MLLLRRLCGKKKFMTFYIRIVCNKVAEVVSYAHPDFPPHRQNQGNGVKGICISIYLIAATDSSRLLYTKLRGNAKKINKHCD